MSKKILVIGLLFVFAALASAVVPPSPYMKPVSWEEVETVNSQVSGDPDGAAGLVSGAYDGDYFLELFTDNSYSTNMGSGVYGAYAYQVAAVPAGAKSVRIDLYSAAPADCGAGGGNVNMNYAMLADTGESVAGWRTGTAGEDWTVTWRILNLGGTASTVEVRLGQYGVADAESDYRHYYFDKILLRYTDADGTWMPGSQLLDNGSFELATQVPEPATICLLGLSGLFLRRRRS
jgi:hypothetical protein